MKITSIYILVLSLLALSLLSCDGLDEDYSSNPNHRLSFSVETLAFDTVFTQIGSATKQFMIYNFNAEPLLINEIMLAGAGQTGFRINVDGRKGDYFKQVRIPAKDSLYVFVEVTVDPNGKNQPLLINDSVLFMVNGIRQSVILEAYGQDVNLYRSGYVITEPTYLTAHKPYLIYDSLVVSPGVTVEIEAGAVFYMHAKANLINYGKILARGSLEQPIIFRGDRLDFILNDVLPYDRTPGQWGGMFFRSESFGNEMEHVIVRNGTTGLMFEKSVPDKSKLRISYAQITNMSENLFTAFNCSIQADNSEFTNAGGGVMILLGGHYAFTHCTLANYMTLEKRRTECLTMSNNANDVIYPLSVRFDNCIVDGSFDAGLESLKGELNLSVAAGGTFDYLFNHCVLKTMGQSSEQFSDVLFTSTSPSYRLKGGEKNKYKFDFRPDSTSTLGVGKADISISKNYPTDRYGVNRIENNSPDIGAYQYTPKETE